MSEKSPVFKETYKNYLDQVAGLEFKSLEEKLGIKTERDKVTIPFFNKPYVVSKKRIINPAGKEPSLEISVVLCKYLLLCPDVVEKEDDWVAYRDFKDSSPLTTFFLTSVEQPIANHFSGRLNELEESCKTLGGFSPDIQLSYQLSMQFNPLPKVPQLMLYNDADDEFPAHCSVLFNKNAEKYLDAECLAILGTLLSIYLRNPGR
jgi:hypothetical protein